MACNPEILRQVPLFALLDDDEMAVLAAKVELKQFGSRQKIYKAGDPGGRGYIVMSGAVEVRTVDEEEQDVVVDQPRPGEFFGFASMLEGTPHQTSAVAAEATTCIEVDRDDIAELLKSKPSAGMDMLAVLGHQYHAAESLVRRRSGRNPNEVIEEQSTLAERVADSVARFGGSWMFISTFGILMAVYTAINVTLGRAAWDPYPFILLNLFLSLLAAVQAPIILMSQNRQDTKDRLRSELDYEVNRRAANDIQGLTRKLSQLEDKLDDVTKLLEERPQP